MADDYNPFREMAERQMAAEAAVSPGDLKRIADAMEVIASCLCENIAPALERLAEATVVIANDDPLAKLERALQREAQENEGPPDSYWYDPLKAR